MPGIAGATGTRLDSAAKHIMACKVNGNLMMHWCRDPKNARQILNVDKMKYCVHKNDLVLNCNQTLNNTQTLGIAPKAYPSVVSNLGDMTSVSKHLLSLLYHHGDTGLNFFQGKKVIENLSKAPPEDIAKIVPTENEQPCSKVVMELKNMPYFTAQGFALGQAFASDLSGDTVSSVLIGGMQTVMNGDFEIRTGQLVQWYFDFEYKYFHRENQNAGGSYQLSGSRKKTNTNFLQLEVNNRHALLNDDTKENTRTDEEKRRMNFILREQGALDAYPQGGQIARKHNVAYPKPYVLSSDGSEHYADKIRIFAKCVNGARPWEPVDIMLMTQSLWLLKKM